MRKMNRLLFVMACALAVSGARAQDSSPPAATVFKPAVISITAYDKAGKVLFCGISPREFSRPEEIRSGAGGLLGTLLKPDKRKLS